MREGQKLLRKVSKGKGAEADIKKLYDAYGAPHAAQPWLFRADMALKAASLGYFKWPAEIQSYIQGKRILDVGCGSGTYSIGFVTLGAREYIGIDLNMKLDTDIVKNKHGARNKGGLTARTSFGWTPNEISAAFPQISFFRGTFEELRSKRKFVKFDLIVMHTVTEHLMEIDDVFAGCFELLVEEGRLIYLHDNFYSWNGHHMAPKRVADIDQTDPEQQKYLDWNHILFDPPEGHYFRRKLNRIRLDDLKELTERYFVISEWREIENDYGRMTEEIRSRLLDYSVRELTTSKVFCVASKKRQVDQRV